MSVLNGKEIKEFMKNDNYDKKLLVTPLLDEEQIGPASIDVRLGSSIIIPQKTYVDRQDVTEKEIIQEVERILYKKIQLQYFQKFILHPNELILGVTFEYISIPNELFATIASRSSWGRLGLVIATASAVQPGFKGCLTLELINLSENPIALYPGLLVGQLIFYKTGTPEGKSSYDGRYDCPTEAGLPQFFDREKYDDEMVFWGGKNNKSSNLSKL